MPEIDYSIELSEISMLHIDLIKYDYLKKNPEVYKKYKKQIELLSKWLFANDLIIEKISKKERSFEIFGHEKTLDDSCQRTELGTMFLLNPLQVQELIELMYLMMLLYV